MRVRRPNARTFLRLMVIISESYPVLPHMVKAVHVAASELDNALQRVIACDMPLLHEHDKVTGAKIRAVVLKELGLEVLEGCKPV